MTPREYARFSRELLQILDEQLDGVIGLLRKKLRGEGRSVDDTDLLEMILGTGIMTLMSTTSDQKRETVERVRDAIEQEGDSGLLWRIFERAEREGTLPKERPVLFLVRAD